VALVAPNPPNDYLLRLVALDCLATSELSHLFAELD